MRLAIIMLVMSLGGCKTAEFAFIYPTTGLHMVAKFEAKEDQAQLAAHPAGFTHLPR